MYVIGLTGNIGVGKSTVLRLLQELGSAVIDADHIARAVVQPQSPAWHAIRRQFGAGVMLADGHLNRTQLGEMVFTDAQALRALEAIVHPAVLTAIEQRLAVLRQRGTAVVTIEAIKLLEGNLYPLCDTLWVVTCTPEQQLARLTTARGWSVAQARRRIAAQAPIADRLAAAHASADVLIDNSGTIAATRTQVQQEFYRISS